MATQVMKFLAVAIAVVFLGLQAHAQAPADTQQGRRVALVIGNNAYKGTRSGRELEWPRLENAVNDADAIAAQLRRSGFMVEVRHDLGRRQLYTELQRFAQKVAGADQAFFYFAGHGVQLFERNYLIPIDAGLSTSEPDLKADAVPFDEVLASVSHGSGLKVVVLDACRTVPRGFRGAESQMLANPEARGKLLPQTLVVFAAQHGEDANDGPGMSNGLFAQGLLKGMDIAEPTLFNVIAKAEEEVLRLSGQRQRPVVYGSPLAQQAFRFGSGRAQASLTVAPSPDVTPPPPRPTAAVAPAATSPSEDEYWSRVRGSSDPQAFLRYQVLFPRGQYIAQARERAGGIAYRSKSGCHVRESSILPDEVDIEWSGNCQDGLADGSGAKTYLRNGIRTIRWSGTYNAGIPVGTWRGEHFDTGTTGRTLTILSRDSAGHVRPEQEFEQANGVHYRGETNATDSSPFGRPHGKGTMKFADGVEYTGNWVDGKRHGAGVQRWIKAAPGGLVRYEGEFKENMLDGRGTLTFENGTVYDGEFRNGLRHGQGRQTFADGGVYEGSWDANKRSGFGTLKFPSSTNPNATVRYVGNFSNDAPGGRGAMEFQNGGKHEGTFLNGRPDGQVRVTRPDGSVFFQQWERGAPQP